MAIFVTLEIDQFEQAFNTRLAEKTGARRYGAGQSDVRRPLRGIEIKADTYATIRVVQADGNEIPLFDSSNADGLSNAYSNFLLQSVQEARMEKHQIVDTFGEPYVYFFGEAPRFLDINTILLNSFDFNWQAEWWQNYDRYLRGTKLVEQGARCYLFYDDNIVEGYILQAQAVTTEGDPKVVQMSFRLFVTNYANISNIGDPYFPVRDMSGMSTEVLLAGEQDKYNQIASASNTYNLQKRATDDASEAFVDYLRQVGQKQIQQEIAHARSLEQARRAQQQYALQQLGLGGPDLLGLTAGVLKEGLLAVKRAAQGDNIFGSQEARRRFQDNVQKGLDATGRATHDAGDPAGDAFLKAGEAIQTALTEISNDPAAALTKGTAAAMIASAEAIRAAKKYTDEQGARLQGKFNLADILRRGLYYSTPYPGQNIDAFLRNASMSVYMKSQPPPELVRILAQRSKYFDNYDEYTNRQSGQEYLNRTPQAQTGVQHINQIVQVIEKETCKRGGKPDAKSWYGWGMVSWSPGDGFKSDSGSGATPEEARMPGGLGSGYPGLGYPGFGMGQAGGFGGTGRGPVMLNPNYTPAGYGGYTLGFGKGFKPVFTRSLGQTAQVGGAYGGAMGGSLGSGVGGGWGGYGVPNNEVTQEWNNYMKQNFNNQFGPTSGTPYGLGYGPGGPSTVPTYYYTAGIRPDGSTYSESGTTNDTWGWGQPAGSSWSFPGGGIGVGMSSWHPSGLTLGGGINMTATAGLGGGILGSGVFGTQILPGALDPTGQSECK